MWKSVWILCFSHLFHMFFISGVIFLDQSWFRPLRLGTNDIASFCIGNRLRQMAFLCSPKWAKAVFRFICSCLFRYHIKQIDSMLLCDSSVIDHRWRQNVPSVSLIDRTLRLLGLVKHTCFIRVSNIEKACLLFCSTLPLYHKVNEEV